MTTGTRKPAKFGQMHSFGQWDAVLLPADHPNYIDNTHFSTESAIHRKTKKIVTQMKLGPLLSSLPKRRRTSGVYQPKANDDQPHASDTNPTLLT